MSGVSWVSSYAGDKGRYRQEGWWRGPEEAWCVRCKVSDLSRAQGGGG